MPWRIEDHGDYWVLTDDEGEPLRFETLPEFLAWLAEYLTNLDDRLTHLESTLDL